MIHVNRMRLDLVAVLLFSILAATPAAANKIFAGKVEKVDARGSSFTLKPAASKKYPQVTLLVDKKTAWIGHVPSFKALKPGQVVTVQCTPVKDSTFKAVSVNAPDPNLKPSAGRASPGG